MKHFGQSSLLVAAMLLLATQTLSAVDYTWTGATSNVFADPTNWNPSTAYPADNRHDTVLFNNAVNTVLDFGGATRSTSSITFSPGAGAFVFPSGVTANMAPYDPGVITVNAGVTADQTFNCNITTRSPWVINNGSGAVIFGAAGTVAATYDFSAYGPSPIKFDAKLTGGNAGGYFSVGWDGGTSVAEVYLNSATNDFPCRINNYGGNLYVGANSPLGGPGALGTSTLPVWLGSPYRMAPASLVATVGGITIGQDIIVREGSPSTALMTIGGTNTAGVVTFTGNIQLGDDGHSGGSHDLTVTAAAGGTVNFAGNLNAYTTVGGVVTVAKVTKAGAGVVKLSGANTYTGDTIVNEGTLLVNGSTAAGGNVTVNAGTLGGAGTINLAAAKNLVVAGGANLTPGNPTGPLTVTGSAGAVLLGGSAAPAVFGVNLASAGSFSQLATDAPVTLNNSGGTNLGIALLGSYVPTAADSFIIISNTGAGPITGAFANDTGGKIHFTSGTSNYTFDISYTGGDGNDIVLNNFAAPITLLSGDANKDGKVSFADYILLANNFGQTGATWDMGDFNGDGKVSFADYILLANNFGQHVPEPATLGLLLIGGLGLIRRNRK